MSKTVWEEMFGTPEAAAYFLVYDSEDMTSYCPFCEGGSHCNCGFDFEQSSSAEVDEHCYNVMLDFLNSVISKDVDMTTHFFNDIPYEVNGKYKVIGKLNMDRNFFWADEYKNIDVLVLYNLETFEIEIKPCFRKDN